MREDNINELYTKVYEEALQSKELIFDVLAYLNFEYDYRVSNDKYAFFKVPYASQKTGSLNVFKDKGSGNYPFYDFLTGWSGNVFTLLSEIGLNNGEKIHFLLENYRHHFSLSENEVNMLLNNYHIPRYAQKKVTKIYKDIKNKNASKKIIARENSLPYIVYMDALYASKKILPQISKTINTKDGLKDIYPYKDIAKYLEEKRGIKECECIATTLSLKSRTEKDKNGYSKTIGYNSAIAVPFGIFDYEKIKSMNSDELKELLKTNGAELRLVKEIDGLKSYTKVGQENPLSKCPTLLDKKSDQLIVFESIFDYLSVSKEIENSDVLIMNGASMYSKLDEMLEHYDFSRNYKNIIFMQQNDKASYNMIFNMLDSKIFKNRIKTESCFIFRYQRDEDKKDINDLVKERKIKNKDDILNRLLEVNIPAFYLINEAKNLQKQNNSLAKLLEENPIFLDKKSNQLIIFESIMDYLSVSKYVKHSDVLIVNDTSMIKKIGNFFKNAKINKDYKNIIFMQQNNDSGYEIMFKLLESKDFKNHIHFNNSYVFNYKKDEKDKEISDLILEGKIKNTDDILSNRLIKTKIINPKKVKFDYQVEMENPVKKKLIKK